MRAAIALIAALLALAGCAQKPVAHERDNPLIGASYTAVDQIVAARLPAMLAAPERKVLVATIVDVNRLDRAAPLGRLLAEQLASRLAQLGVSVAELKLRGNLFVSAAEGELLLSRELREISAAQQADLVVVGTYADGGSKVYVTIKLVRTADSVVAAAHNFAVDKVGSVENLLRADR